MGIVDFEAGRQVIGDDDAAELRLSLSNFQHYNKARVLLDLRRIDRIAIHRIGEALDLKSLFGRGFGRERNAGDGNDGFHRAVAGVGHRQRRLQTRRR